MRWALLGVGSLKADHSGYGDAHVHDGDGDAAARPRLCFSQYPKLRFYRGLQIPVS